MALKKRLIGELVKSVDERNKKGDDFPFFGININKEFMPTVADTSGLDSRKYKIVRKNRFVYSGMQTGRDICIRIGLYTKDNPVLVSPAYTTFEVISEDILPEYLFMIFNSSERDRYGAFLSDGSVRANLDWDVFCNIELKLPSIDIQRKYVNIYNSLIENQRAYETGLDDLKLTCDATIEKLRRDLPSEEIGNYIKSRSEKNEGECITNVLGISKEGFIDPRANMDGISLKNYNVFYFDDFVYSPPRINVGSIGLYKGLTPAVCSPIYNVFRVINKDELLPDYLDMWFRRSEFLRSTDYFSIGSVRNNFDMECMREVEIPIPSMDVQIAVSDIYKCYLERKSINESLKQKLKTICPILIRGSLKEGA